MKNDCELLDFIKVSERLVGVEVYSVQFINLLKCIHG